VSELDEPCGVSDVAPAARTSNAGSDSDAKDSSTDKGTENSSPDSPISVNGPCSMTDLENRSFGWSQTSIQTKPTISGTACAVRLACTPASSVQNTVDNGFSQNGCVQIGHCKHHIASTGGNLPQLDQELRVDENVGDIAYQSACPWNMQPEDQRQNHDTEHSGLVLTTGTLSRNSAAIEVAIERYLAQAEAVEPSLQGKDVVLHALRLAVEDRLACHRCASVL
jgi:hypothetical protein